MAAVSYIIVAGGTLETVVAGTNPPGEDVATITSGSASIAASNDFAAGFPVQFAGSFGTITGIVAGTTYYVSATGLTTAAFQVAATPGGTPITPAGGGSATPTVFVLGAVEICMDQTITAVTDSQSTTGTRAVKKGEIQQLIRILEEYLIRDTNVVE
jgi:hypothetical protein